MSSSRFCSSNCGRTVDVERNGSHCCQQCADNHGNTSNHAAKCEQLYNEYLNTIFNQNEEKTSNQWICSICTFKNECYRTKCNICYTSKPMDIDTKRNRKRKYDQISVCDHDDDDDDDIIILNSNKKRKLNENENRNNSVNRNQFRSILDATNPTMNKLDDNEDDDDDILDPELRAIKNYHEMRKKRFDNLEIPGDYMIDYELIEGKKQKLTCFHQEKLIRMEQDKQFKEYEKEIKQLNDKMNTRPKQLFNWKIIEYIIQQNQINQNEMNQTQMDQIENKQIIQLQKPKNGRNNRLKFSIDTGVLLFCSCCLNKKETVKVNSILTEEQREMIERKRVTALQRLAKTQSLYKYKGYNKKQNKVRFQFQQFIKDNYIIYGKIIDIDTKTDKNMIIITVRINKWNKYLSEYVCTDNKEQDTQNNQFHDKKQCLFHVLPKMKQFTTFQMELRSIETFFASTVHQLSAIWSNNYYYIENKNIGNGSSLITKKEIVDIMKEEKLLNFPVDIMMIIANFIEEPIEYTDIIQMNDKLNLSQIRAIYNSCTKRVSVIQGPPGTGKTYTAIAIIQKLFHSNSINEVNEHKVNKRVICSAHTHAACDQILDEMVKYEGTQNLNITRFANPSQMKAKDLIRFSYREKMKNHRCYNEMVQYFQESKNRRRTRSQRENFRSMAEDLEVRMSRDILMNSQVIISTCFALTRRIFDDDDLMIDMIIIDEATQILEPEVIGVINLLTDKRGRMSEIKNRQKRDKWIERECNDNFESMYPGTLSQYINVSKTKRFYDKRIVMIGDPKQLSPIVNSKDAENKGRGITWFHRILCKISSDDMIHNKYGRYQYMQYMQNDNDIYTMLNVQYRGWNILHEFNNMQFYHSKIKHDKIWSGKPLIGGFEWKNNAPFNFVNVINSEQRRKGGDYDNPKEAEIVVNIVGNILNYGNSWNTMDIDDIIKIKKMEQIGIVVWHRGQKKSLNEKMTKVFGKEMVKNLMISTIDAFQGQQKDVIILSLTRTDNRNTTFINDITRINVALSRSKLAMIIVGNIKQLDTNNTFYSLQQYLQKRHLIKSVSYK